MAIAEAVGHNKRGKTIFKRNPDGSIILEDAKVAPGPRLLDSENEHKIIRAKRPSVNDELDDVADCYLEWLEKMASLRLGRRKGS